MEGLDLLKKDWKNREEGKNKLSFDDIYTILLKKSSSVVKWIFYISVIEFAFWHLIYLIPNNNAEIYHEMDMMPLINGSTIIHYIITISFIYIFYKNYKRITSTDSAKKLMRSILKTRKTVQFYVIYNLGMFALLFIIFSIYFYLNLDKLITIEEFKTQVERIPNFTTIFFIVEAIMAIIMLVIFGGLYFLIYGRMLKKLKLNYKELKSLDE